MTISRVNPGGWAFRSILTSAQANAIDTNTTYALDIRSGQSAIALSNVQLNGTLSVNVLPSQTLTIGMQTPTSDTTVYSTNLTTCAPFASATVNKSTGNFNVFFPAPVSGGTHGSLNLWDSGNNILQITSTDTFTAFLTANAGTLQLGSATSSVIVQSGASGHIELNAPGVGVLVDKVSHKIDFTNGIAATTLFQIDTSSGGFKIVYPSVSGNGANSIITGQTSTGAIGGPVILTGGLSNASTGGSVNLTGGGSAGTGTSGGDCTIAGGTSSGTNTNGGNVLCIAGTGTGSGKTGNVFLGGFGSGVGSMQGGVFIANVSVVASTTPVGGGCLYVDPADQLLKFKSANGTFYRLTTT